MRLSEKRLDKKRKIGQAALKAFLRRLTFDMPVQVYLTRKQNKKLKELQKQYPGKYRFLPTNLQKHSSPIWMEILFLQMN